MANTIDPDTTEARARELLDKRIQSVRALVTTRQTRTHPRPPPDTAERAAAAPYTAALRDGWTAEELKQLGLPEPGGKPRPRRPSKPAPATT